jgi:YaiO family outer membrane protein
MLNAHLLCTLALFSGASALATSVAADEQALRTLQALVADAPDDTDARYALARAYAGSKRFPEAASEYDALISYDGGNADWLLGKAQVLLALQRAAEAVPLLQRAHALAPDYEDVWRTEAAALEAAGEETNAIDLLAAAQARFPDAGWPASRSRQLREARLSRSGTRLSASAAYEDLSGAHARWRSGAVALDRPLRAGTRFAMAFAVEQRYDKQDEQFALGIVQRFGRGWVIDAGGEVAPHGELLPETQLHLEVGRPLSRALSGSLRYRHAHYASLDVDALAAAMEYGSGSYRAAYTLTASKPSEIDTRFGHALRVARDYGAGSSVSLLLGRGEEAETIAPGQVLVTRNTAVVLYGTHWRSPAWGLTWSCGWNEQGELYDRLGIRLGIEHRF